MAKNWWFKFDYRIWRTDSNLRRCSFETRGFWLELLCAMYESDTYEITGSYEELGWLVGCDSAVVARCVTELMRTKTADVTLGNGSVTVLSRRLKRELSDREHTRLRVQRHRRNGDVTAQSKSKSNKEENKSKKEEKREDVSQPKAVAQPTTTKGTRLPSPFLLTSEMRSWALAQRPTLDAAAETEKFVDYWRAKAGKDGVKLDWTATWRNWIRNAKENGNGNYRQQRSDTAINERNFFAGLRNFVEDTGEQVRSEIISDDSRLLRSGGS